MEAIKLPDGRLVRAMPEHERQRQLAERRTRLDAAHKLNEELNAAYKRNDSAVLQKALTQAFVSFEFFCDNFVWIFDPRPGKDPVARFVLWDYQRRDAPVFVRAVEYGGNVLLEKSRGIGATWFDAALLSWFYLKKKFFHALVGSRKEDLVDDSTVDSIFGKIDFVLMNLPEWMRRMMPYDPREKKCRSSLRIANREGSLISGESSNPNFGRGPRKNVIYFDEYAFTEYDREIWTSVSQTAPCKILTSTPNGSSNMFAILRNSGACTVVTWHWTDNPECTQEWYDAECARLKDDALIAQELNIDYEGSGGRPAFPMLIQHEARIVVPVVDLDPSQWRFSMGLDYGTTNPSAVICVAQAVTKAPGQLLPRMKVVWQYYEPSTVKKISDAIKTCPYHRYVDYIWADPSMWAYNQYADDTKAMTSVALLFQKYHGVFLSAGARGDAFVLAQLEMMWEDPNDPLLEIFDSCPDFIREMKGLKFQKQSAQMSAKSNPSQKLQDKNNHSFDAFKYFFNRTFNAEEELTSPHKNGYDALTDQMANLKAQKLKTLTTKPKRTFRSLFRSVS